MVVLWVLLGSTFQVMLKFLEQASNVLIIRMNRECMPIRKHNVKHIMSAFKAEKRAFCVASEQFLIKQYLPVIIGIQLIAPQLLISILLMKD